MGEALRSRCWWIWALLAGVVAFLGTCVLAWRSVNVRAEVFATLARDDEISNSLRGNDGYEVDGWAYRLEQLGSAAYPTLLPMAEAEAREDRAIILRYVACQIAYSAELGVGEPFERGAITAVLPVAVASLPSRDASLRWVALDRLKNAQDLRTVDALIAHLLRLRSIRGPDREIAETIIALARITSIEPARGRYEVHEGRVLDEGRARSIDDLATAFADWREAHRATLSEQFHANR
jgi:hypothetical protein